MDTRTINPLLTALCEKQFIAPGEMFRLQAIAESKPTKPIGQLALEESESVGGHEIIESIRWNIKLGRTGGQLVK